MQIARPIHALEQVLQEAVDTIDCQSRIIFAGHDHIYERGVTDGLRYLISGGGGGSNRSSNSVSGTLDR